MSGSETPHFMFVVIFLLFSLLFLWNSFKLWFRTDEYYRELRDSLTREPSIYPFREFFLKRMENRKRWEFQQKAFSLFGVAAVIAADVLVVAAFLG
ncbi:MAG TPA: hypothetical protein PLF42_14350 [Anaerolineales bacterium]|nr:hypothetical protein [Anaerolineales bacterium]